MIQALILLGVTLTLSLQAAPPSEADTRSLSQFFADYKVPAALQADLATLTNLKAIQEGSLVAGATAALQNLKQYPGQSSELYGVVPALLQIAAKSEQESLRLAAIDVLSSTVLKEKDLDPAHVRIAQELSKILRETKKVPKIATALRKAVAYTGDPMSVNVLAEHAESFSENPNKDELWSDLSEYFTRIGVNRGATVPVAGFQRLEQELRKMFGGDDYANAARDIWLRQIAMEKLKRGDRSFLEPSTKQRATDNHTAPPATNSPRR